MKQGAVLLIFSTLMLSLLSTQAMRDPLEEDEFLDKNGILYEDTSYYIDPNDMLADVTLRRHVIKKKAALDESMEKQKRIAHGINECMNIERELHSCQAQHDLLQQQLQSKETSNAKLVSKLSEGNAVDFELHYRRALSLLLQSLQVQTHGWAESSTMQRQLTFVLSEELVTGLQHCIKNKSSGDLVRHCDQVISSLYDAVELAENEIGSYFLWPSFEISSIHGIEMLQLMLTAVIVSLLGWAAILLLWDVRTKRRWWPFMVLLLVLVFTLCCLWNWSVMIKEVEAERAAALERQGLEGSPEECRATGFWAWLSGADETCTKYYADVFISATQKISPDQVVVRTLTALVLSPLRALGRECGLFFHEFYGNMSFLYVLPSSVMLIAILGMFLYCCRGGRGHDSACGAHDQLPSSGRLDLLSNELRLEQQKFLVESRSMLVDIATALHTSTQRSQVVQPLLESSCRRIETQLDSLIASRLQALACANPTQTTQHSDRLALTSPSSPAKETKSNKIVTSPVRGSQVATPTTDCLDGSNSPSPEEPKLSTSTDFLQEVMNLVDTSLSECSLANDELPNAEDKEMHGTTLERRMLSNSAPLSPASKKFLGRLRDEFKA